MIFVVTGNFGNGFQIVGPFSSFEEADTWFDAAGGMGTLWLIQPLDPNRTLIDQDKCAYEEKEYEVER